MNILLTIFVSEFPSSHNLQSSRSPFGTIVVSLNIIFERGNLHRSFVFVLVGRPRHGVLVRRHLVVDDLD